MTSGIHWAAVVASTAGVAWLVVWLVRRHALRLGLIDRPNHRSSHTQPTPRGGGVGIVLGAGTGLFVASELGTVLPHVVWIVFGAVALVALEGLLDDFMELPPGLRLLVQAVAATVFVAAMGPLNALPLPAPLNLHLPAPVGWVLSILWIMALTNFFNFMDGIDGLAGGQAVASFVGVMLAGWSPEGSLLAACAGAAVTGFLLHNWSPARVFMGDVGSDFLGFLIAALPFLAPVGRRGDAVLAVAVGLALFLLDPVETLIRRARARKPLYRAHREHVYQQHLDPGEPAGRIAGMLVAAGSALVLLGVAAYRRPSFGWVALVVAVLVYLVERRIAERRSRTRRRHVPTCKTEYGGE
jgi:Fuc2NAc and GlcNAc transferase